MLTGLVKISIFFINYIACLSQHKNAFTQAFRSTPGCQTCLCKQGINSNYSTM